MSFLAESRKPTQSVLDEAANAVLACAITAVFLLKNKMVPVDASHVMTMLDYAENGPDTDFNSMETASDTYDQITMRIPLSPECREYLYGGTIDHCLVDSIIEFVNNYSKLNDLAASVTNNGLLNRIVIDIDNVSVEYPATTSIMIDNDEVNIGTFALPIYDFRTGIGGIGKKELLDDYGYAEHRKFINSSFGLDIGEDHAVYYQTSHNNGSPTVESVETATRQLYDEVCRRINQGLSGAYDSPLNDFKHNLIAAMLGCCFGVRDDSDTYCVIIPSSRVDYTAFNAKEIFETLYTTKLQAKCPSHMNPSIRIVDGENRELFQVRFKKERYGDNVTGHRYKMYFKPTRLKEYF